MKRLLHIEWLKVSSYRSFYVFTGIYAILIFFTYFGVNSFLNLGPLFDVNSVYKFPNVWYFVSYVSSWFSPILSILMILLVCNEFAFRTLRQHIIDSNIHRFFQRNNLPASNYLVEFRHDDCSHINCITGSSFCVIHISVYLVLLDH